MPRTVRLNCPECAGAIGAELYSACVNQWAALWEFQTKKGPILQRRLRVGEVGEASIIQAVAQGRCLVAFVAGDVLGIATYEPERFFGRDFVPFVYVGPRSRGQGVARQLPEFLVSLDGTGDLFTSTNESNLPMRRLLEAGGWLFSGRLNGLDEEDPELVYFYRR